jgi:hypothetical protein
VIVFVRKYKNRWQFEERGVYFSLDEEELREMHRLCADILQQVEAEVEVDSGTKPKP